MTLKEVRARKFLPKRRKKPRRGPMRCKAYMDWLTKGYCAIYASNPRAILLDCELPLDSAHTQNNGMSSKGPDSSCAPLCRRHHREYDAGRKSFEAKYSVDMSALAAAHWKRFCEETGFKENEK